MISCPVLPCIVLLYFVVFCFPTLAGISVQ
nr:MAG TPA: hypothetical protein [Caudoviricetes sp.]